MVASTVATMITPKSGVRAEPSEDTTSVMVLSSVDCKAMSGHKNAFHDAMKAMMKAAA